MGWTSYHAQHYKKGVVDRKAELDCEFSQPVVDKNRKKIGTFKVLKSSMVGSTYYAAVQKTIFSTETEPEKFDIFAVVCFTHTDMKDYYNFSYKDMSEDMEPFYYDCPRTILDLLTPADSENANRWRNKCREQLAIRTKQRALRALPLGSVIEVIAPRDFKKYKKGDVMKLTKRQVRWKKVAFCDNEHYYDITSLGTDYKVIKNA